MRDNSGVSLMLGFAARTGHRLAEVGFLLVLIAGIWLVAAELPRLNLRTVRTMVAGVLLAIAGLLLVIAARWGHFG